LLRESKGVFRATLRWAWVYFLYITGLIWWARRCVARRGAIIVLTFHRVLSRSEQKLSNSLAGIVVGKETFDSLARYVSSRYEIVNLGKGEPNWPPGNHRARIAFTFDDGWADNARLAFPIARQYGIPLAVFICPGRVGQEGAFWPERVAALWRAAQQVEGLRNQLATLLARFVPDGPTRTPAGIGGPEMARLIEELKSWQPKKRDWLIAQMAEVVETGSGMRQSAAVDATMGWGDIRFLAENGVTFGSHTQNHQILTCIPLNEVKHEIETSKRVIEQTLGSDCALFSYPNGNFSPQVKELVARAGYRFAFSTRTGAWTRECDRWLVPRINVWEGMLVGPWGRFSRVACEYALFWKAYRSLRSGDRISAATAAVMKPSGP